MTTAYLPPFPTDEMTLRLLIEACSMGDNDQTNLGAFLEMGAVEASRTDITHEVGDGEGASVYFVEYEEGTEPYSPQHVIDTLAREVLKLRGEQP